MTVVFSVLGKILYVLLMIIGILLLLVLVLLICPIHYQGTFEKQEEFSAKGAVRWLFFLVYLPFSYEHGKFRFSIRIFGIPFFRERKRKKGKTEGKAELAVMETVSEETVSEDQNESDGDEEEDLEEKDSTREEESDSYDTEGVSEEKREKKKGRKKQGFPDLRGIFGRIREKSSLATDVKGFFKEDNTKQMICIIKDNVVHLLKKLKPEKLKGYIEFGTGDPCQTGQVLGGLACLYAYYGGSVEIVPDFMEKKLSGHLYVRGRIALLTIVIPLLREILSRGFGRFKKELNELKEAI